MGFVVVQVSQALDFVFFWCNFQSILHGWSALPQQKQAGSDLNILFDDVIHERCPNVSVYTNIYALKNEKKIIQWSPLWIIFKGKIKNAHLLQE